MRSCSFILALVLITACGAVAPERVAPVAGGALLLDIIPNPIVAYPLGGDLFEFPFDVAMREVGGRDIEIDAIRVEIKLKGLPIFAQTFDETELTRRGYPAIVPAGGLVQYRFSPRREVPGELLFDQVSARITISGLDQNGRRSEASTTVYLRKSITPK